MTTTQNLVETRLKLQQYQLKPQYEVDKVDQRLHGKFDQFDEFTKKLGDDCIDIHSEQLFEDFNQSLYDNSQITMLPNYNIQPSGHEFGKYLVIDLGGSTLRVSIIEIDKEYSEETFVNQILEESNTPGNGKFQNMAKIDTPMNGKFDQFGNLVENSNYTLDETLRKLKSKVDEKLDIDSNSGQLLSSTDSLTNSFTSADSFDSVASTDRSSRIHIVVEKSWIIPNDFKIIDYNFFKFIGSKINEIVLNQKTIDFKSIISTGITWSFPLETISHNRGKIVHVSKGYTIAEEIYNQDLKDILEQVLNEQFNLHIDVKVIVNDSLAVYAAGAFIDKYIKLGLVLGTGINMCCSLNASEKIHEKKILKGESKMLFNTELSLFGHQLIPDFVNKYDEMIDPRFGKVDSSFRSYMTVEPNSNLILQPHELMTSGRYLPELTRLVIADLVSSKLIFQNLGEKYLLPLTTAFDGFSGELMCFIDETENTFEIIEKIAQTYHWPRHLIKVDDVLYLKDIINNIIKRASIIVSIIIIAFIKLLKYHNPDLNLGKKLDIGFVGSVLYYFNNYRNSILSLINNHQEVKKLGLTVDFKLIENSSIIGAAIGAAYYS